MATGNRAALITGSGRNMGRACAKELAQAGFNIVVNGSKDQADPVNASPMKSARSAPMRLL